MHSPLRHARSLFLKTRPIHLTFFVTRRCNARCPFCFYAAARDAEDGAPELRPDEIRRVAGSLDALLWVLFSGGEPFLREDLAEVAQVFHDVNRAAFLTFPTNGLLPEAAVETTADVLRRCPESVVVVKVSLDGVGERHDAVRGTPGGFAKAVRTCEGLARLAAREPRLELGVNTLLGAANRRDVPDVVRFVHGLAGVRAHTITLERAPGGGPAPGVGADDHRAATELLERLWSTRREPFHRFAGARLKAAQDRLQRRLLRRTLAERRRVLPCYAGRLNLVLTERGELHPCESRWALSFGNVRDAGYDVRAMLRSARGRAVAAEVERGACWCAHECNLLTNILFHPGTQPALVREWARLGTDSATGDGRPGQEAIA